MSSRPNLHGELGILMMCHFEALSNKIEYLTLCIAIISYGTSAEYYWVIKLLRGSQRFLENFHSE